MTFEEMEKSIQGLAAQMKHIENAQVVQGVLEHRIEERIDDLTNAAEANNRALEKLLQVVASHEERIAHNENGMEILRDGLSRMEGAMNALFERMDRFIRGLESNGHERRRRS